MDPKQWEKVSEIFHAASEMPSAERAEFLSKRCGDDTEIRVEVESLLAAESGAGDFIKEPIIPEFPRRDVDDEPWSYIGGELGHYRIERNIGSGGMGDVYLATDTRLNRKVAIKTLPTAFAKDPAFVKRFRIEAQAAANLNHPNVATIYSVEEIDDRSIITMEYVEGKVLSEITPDRGLDIRTFLDWFIPISDALAHAHERGIVHRDIKPGNIMITTDGTPKILDFGLAQMEIMPPDVTGLSITQPGQIIGTPSYMSPEQAEGKTVDYRSDIFSLGVVMFEALTGERPFKGSSHAEVVSNVLKSDPPSISQSRSEIPALIVKLVEKCLVKSPRGRIHSMNDVNVVLSEAWATMSRGSLRDSSLRRLYREFSPRPSRWLAVAAAAVVLLAVGAWYFISRSAPEPPFSVDKIAIRKLSQSNNVALAIIAPDGRSVAYVTYEDDGGRSLWLRRVSDAHAIRVVPSQQVHYWDIVFSNDSEYIYFITAPRFGTHGTLYRVPSIGGQARKIADKTNHLGNLSPDGKRLLFVRYGDPAPHTSVNVTDSKLISANSDDGSDERIHRTLEGESIIRKVRYAEDGRSIYYLKRELDGVEYWSIVRLDAQTGTEREIIRKKERIEALAELKTSGGLLINAVDPVSNRRQLFYVSLPAGDVTRITNDLNSYIGVSVDSDGRNIVSVQRTDEARIWVGDSADYNSMTMLTRSPVANLIVDWTPDGRIVYDVVENDRQSIWISDPDGKNALQLTPQDSDNFHPRVSGDGRFIVFTSKRAGYNQVWRMAVDGSDPTLLARTPGITQSPRFAADGRTVVFRWYNEGSPPMGQVSVDGGPVTGLDYLPQASTYYWAMSPDGKHVAYTTGGGTADPMRVIVRRVDSPMPTAILNIRPTWIFGWMPDGRNIFYQESQQGEGLNSKVFTVEPGIGEPKLLFSTEPDDIVDLSFSKDGSRFAAVRARVSTDAVILSAAVPAAANR